MDKIPITQEQQRLKKLAEFQSLERSLFWKIFTAYRRGIEWLLPARSLRRKYYDALVRMNQRRMSGELSGSPQIQNNVSAAQKETPTKKSTEDSIDQFEGILPAYENPRVSIIVVSFNKAAFLHQCLDSIIKNTDVPYELIIVDNASGAQTKSFLQKLHGTNVIYNEENMGFGNACNQGAKIARGKYLLFLNNDTIVTSGWLAYMTDTLESIKNCGAVAAKVISFDNILLSAGGIIWSDGSCMEYGRGDHPDHFQYNYLREVDHGTAACLLVRKDIFDRIRGFDPIYGPAYYEDVDLSMAITKAGYKTFYEPRSVIYHNEHTSSSESGVEELSVRNKAKFILKWKDELIKYHHKNRYE